MMIVAPSVTIGFVVVFPIMYLSLSVCSMFPEDTVKVFADKDGMFPFL